MRRRVACLLPEAFAPSHVFVASLTLALVTTASCSLDASPQMPQRTPSAQSSSDNSEFMPAERPGQLGSTDPVRGGKPDAAQRVSIGAMADEDAGSTRPSQDASTMTPAMDAGSSSTKDAVSGHDMPATGPVMSTTVVQTPDAECARGRLREKADAYLQAMANGDPSTLRVHPKLRFTENGREQQLGTGVWLRRGKATFARHAIDESRCSTITEAVLTTVTVRVLFGGRLLYSDGQLLEIETQTVPENATLLANIDAVPPVGADPWIAEVPSDVRMSRDKLIETGQEYFDAATGGAMVPASTPECRRRQNGVPMAMMGSCSVAPGTSRFEQRRFSVVDELLGVATATVLYENHLGFYLFKMADNKMQNIEVLGGATVTDSGW